MQRLLIIPLLMVVLSSCQKQTATIQNLNEFPGLKQSLRDSLSMADYNTLDFSRVASAEHDNGKTVFLRIAFKETKMADAFVLVDVTRTGRINKGRIVNLATEQSQPSFSGTMIVQSLTRQVIRDKTILNGYASSFAMTREAAKVVPDPYVELPEVIVSASYGSGGGDVSFTSWINLVSVFAVNGDSGFYSPLDPFSGGGGSSSGGSSGSGISNATSPHEPILIEEDEIIEVDFESQYDDPAIELEKFIKCFQNIPDAGATCSVTLYTDVPVDDDPTKMFDWKSGSPGHTFLSFTKSNGGKTSTQYLGFYPKKGWKISLTNAAMPGKFVANDQHEFDASYTITATPQNFNSGLVEMMHRKSMQYSVENNNCTDWALAVFKTVLPPNLWFTIPQFHIPGAVSPGSNTPQGLYVKLAELAKAGQAGVQKLVVGWSGYSTGPCK
ncbi:MAG: hypothetical protein ABI675_17960 [Chitinophagaceae bacterium]